MFDSFDQFSGTATYIASEELRHAVNVAVALERPLLVRGEPGTDAEGAAGVAAGAQDVADDGAAARLPAGAAAARTGPRPGPATSDARSPECRATARAVHG